MKSWATILQSLEFLKKLKDKDAMKSLAHGTQAAENMNFKMTKEIFSCPYMEGCSARFDFISGEMCYDESLVKECKIRRLYEIREEIANRTIERKRNIVGILTGNI